MAHIGKDTYKADIIYVTIFLFGLKEPRFIPKCNIVIYKYVLTDDASYVDPIKLRLVLVHMTFVDDDNYMLFLDFNLFLLLLDIL